MTTSTIFAAFALLASTASSVPAFAADVPQVAVHYNDINLSSPAGVQLLQARIKQAARRVCYTSETGLDAVAASAKCERVAIARAMPQAELALANAGARQADNGRVSNGAH